MNTFSNKYYFLLFGICFLFLLTYTHTGFASETEKKQNVPEEFGSKAERKKHPIIPLPKQDKKVSRAFRCRSDGGNSWESVGMDRNWGLVFVDHAPGERRTADILKLLPRTKLMVVHDTQQPSYAWPQGWGGRRSFSENVGGVGTTLIQGHLDEDSGGLFDSILKSLDTNDEANQASLARAKELNPLEGDYGTHLHLLLLTASFVVKEKGGQGDILEMGAGLFSTSELHNMVQKDAASNRMLISADADYTWLQQLMYNFTSDFHQFLLVPVYTDLASCRKGNFQPDIPVEDRNMLGLS